MKTGQEIALAAMKKELKSLKRRAKQAKDKADACLEAPAKALEITKKTQQIVQGNLPEVFEVKAGLLNEWTAYARHNDNLETEST